MKRTALLSAACLSVLLAGCASPAAPNVDPVTVPPAVSSSSSAAPVTEAGASVPQSPSETQSETAASESELSAAPSSPAGPKYSERDNLIKVAGQEAGIMSEDGSELVLFTVHSIVSDFKCTEQFKQKPENGTFIALDVSVETKKGIKDAYSGDWRMNPNDFKTIAPNGTTSNANLSTGPAYTCVKSSKMLPEMGNNEKARGLVILDAENAKGTLVFEDPNTPGGWEWEYPAK